MIDHDTGASGRDLGEAGGALGSGRLLLRIVTVVGLIELAVMLGLRFVPLTGLWRDLFDAAMLAGLITPVLYWVVVKPVGRLAAQEEKARSTLVHELESRRERERMEAERREVESQLRHSQKMEAMGRLAGGIAHDLNNLLTPLIGYSELVLASEESAETHRADVQEIRDTAERAAGLTRQLLAFSRRQPRQTRMLALDELVRDMERLLSRVLGDDIDLVTGADVGLPLVEADPSHIEQVIMNLAVNARDAMSGGGRLTIEVRAEEAVGGVAAPFSAAARAPRVALVVSDTGNGMDEETRSRIFEPFFTTKAPERGTGLGLSTVYGIVHQSGGTISVESEPGRGSVFRVSFPAEYRECQEGSDPGVELPACDAGGSETVLVVDDEAAVLTLVSRVLRRRGYMVLTAATAGEALSLLRGDGRRIDLVLTDVHLSGIDGYALVELVRRECPEAAALCMSGHSAAEVAERWAADAGLPLIEKPFTPTLLCGMVREALDTRGRAA